MSNIVEKVKGLIVEQLSVDVDQVTDDASFVDEEGLSTDAPVAVHDELCRRTPGYNAWQVEHWPLCCNDAAAFLGAVGATELRRDFPDWQGALLHHILYEMKVSGGAATRLLESLHKDTAPTAYLHPLAFGYDWSLEAVATRAARKRRPRRRCPARSAE